MYAQVGTGGSRTMITRMMAGEIGYGHIQCAVINDSLVFAGFFLRIFFPRPNSRRR